MVKLHPGARSDGIFRAGRGAAGRFRPPETAMTALCRRTFSPSVLDEETSAPAAPGGRGSNLSASKGTAASMTTSRLAAVPSTGYLQPRHEL
jgi:hypothetical protein